MKATLFVIILLSCANTFAQTNVDLFPKIPATCKNSKTKVLNYVINTKKTETAQSLEVSFVTFYGKCINKKFEIQPLARYFSIQLFKERINTPWSYVPRYQFERINESMAKVTLKIDKSIVFSRNSKRYFTMMIYPTPRRNTSFRWVMNLDYSKDMDETKVSVTK